MSYGLQLLGSNGAEPLSAEQAKLHLRIDGSDEDDEVNLLIKAVRKFFEKSTGQIFTAQVWLLTLDHFPNYMGSPLPDYAELWEVTAIRIPKSPTVPQGQVTVNSITYVDTTGTVQTADPAQYLVDATTVPIRITPAYGKIWPIARYQTGAVRVQYTVAPLVDEDVLAGMLLLLGHWNEHREGVLAGAFQEVPLGVSAIISLNWTGAYGGKAG